MISTIMANNRCRILLTQVILTSVGLFIVYTCWSSEEPPQCPLKKIDPELVVLKAFTKLLSADTDYPSNINKLKQDSPILIKYTHYRHLTPPSEEPYNLPGPPNARFQNSFSFAVDKIFKGKVGKLRSSVVILRT